MFFIIIYNKKHNRPVMILGMVTNYYQNELERIYLQLYNELNSGDAQIKFMKNIAPEFISKFKHVV